MTILMATKTRLKIRQSKIALKETPTLGLTLVMTVTQDCIFVNVCRETALPCHGRQAKCPSIHGPYMCIVTWHAYAVVGFEWDCACYNPKDGELCLSRVKPCKSIMNFGYRDERLIKPSWKERKSFLINCWPPMRCLEECMVMNTGDGSHFILFCSKDH